MAVSEGDHVVVVVVVVVGGGNGVVYLSGVGYVLEYDVGMDRMNCLRGLVRETNLNKTKSRVEGGWELLLSIVPIQKESLL